MKNVVINGVTFQKRKRTPQEAKERRIQMLKRIIFLVSFCILPIANFLMFYVYVNFSSFFLAFQTEIDGQTVWTLSNYLWVFQELGKASSDILLGLQNTLLTFCLNMCMFTIGFFVSVFLYKKVMGYKLFRIIFFLPGLVAGTLVATFYRKFFIPGSPGANIICQTFGLPADTPLWSTDGWANALIFLNIIWLSFPGDLVIWGGTLSRLPESLIEQGKLDGVSWLREIAQIIIPIIWPTFSLKLIIAFVNMLSAGGNVFLLTGGNYGTMTLGCWMYLQMYNQSAAGRITNMSVLQYMSALGSLMTVIAVIIYAIVKKITDKMDAEVTF